MVSLGLHELSARCFPTNQTRFLRVVRIVACAICIGFLGRTWSRNADWVSTQTIMEATIRVGPRDSQSAFALACNLAETDSEGAVRAVASRVAATVAMDVGSPKVTFQLGSFLRMTGHISAAVELLRREQELIASMVTWAPVRGLGLPSTAMSPVLVGRLKATEALAMRSNMTRAAATVFESLLLAPEDEIVWQMAAELEALATRTLHAETTAGPANENLVYSWEHIREFLKTHC